MRVFLIRNVEPINYGGGESYQIELAKVLVGNNIEPIIVSSSNKLLIEAQKNNFPSVRAPFLKQQNWSGWRNLFLPFYIFWQVRLYFWYKKQIKIYKPDVLDIQSRDDWIAATLAAKKLNITTLWTDHIDFRTWVLQNVNKAFKNPIGKKLLKIARDVDSIVMISDFEADYFRKTVYPKKYDNIKIIKNGVIDELNKYKDVLPKTKSICYVGRLVDYKGVSELIRAFTLIESNTATLHIYGEGADIEKYKKLAQKDKRISFYGYTENPIRAIAESEIFVLPSYYEGLSISLLQAAMLGKIIIASNVDGNPEVVINKQTGLLVPPKDVDSLKNALMIGLSNKNEIKNLGKNIRKKYEKEFNFRTTIEKQLIPLFDRK